MKHIFKGIFLFFISIGSASAAWQGNFLLGVEGGYAWRDGQLEVAITEPPPAGTPSKLSRDHIDNGFIWGIVAGYQAYCKRLLIGGELNAAFQNIGNERGYHAVLYDGDNYGFTANHERSVIYGFSLRVGYVVTKWLMPYIKAGFDTNRETLFFSAVGDDPAEPAYAINHDRRVNRFVGGGGIEFPLVCSLSFRIEYNWSNKARGANAFGREPFTNVFVDATLRQEQHSAKGVLVWNIT